MSSNNRRPSLRLITQRICMPENPDVILYNECLLRECDEGRLTSAGRFVQIMEDQNNILWLDRLVFRLALRYLRCRPSLKLGINMSFKSACLDEAWTFLLDNQERYGDLFARLTIEFTERSIMPCLEKTYAFVEELRRLGCRIAIDDFGGGQEQISRLAVLRPDIVKLNCDSLWEARQRGLAQKEYSALVDISRGMANIVVAEGVETIDDRSFLASLGIEWQQGYYYDKGEFII